MLVRRIWPARGSWTTGLPEIDQVRREMSRLLDSLGVESPAEAPAGVFPPLNVTQDDDHYYVRAEIPGVDAKELSISAARDQLSLSGKREIPEEGKVAYHRRERAEGEFSRMVTLPGAFDAERVEARYADGILTVKLPRTPETKPRQISVKT